MTRLNPTLRRRLQQHHFISCCCFIRHRSAPAIISISVKVTSSPRIFNFSQIMLTESPFRPREKLLEKQRLFQSLQRHTYLKGPIDKITSVALPLALAASSLYMIGTGIYNMSNGIGKKE
ncbi:PREDICTED: uncharacterized protein LOC109127047 [Camelina sativa]|uniref:Uncharacterized protein LOC109127047 n=1 Tax=Camelina sativa TaxID=90675 RepID=A0ABM1QJ33_CAMSA|nr:PREDICTED: uncharacterized protein LOC109127047 [Camelina sativa]